MWITLLTILMAFGGESKAMSILGLHFMKCLALPNTDIHVLNTLINNKHFHSHKNSIIDQGVECMYVSAPLSCNACGCQKRALDSLELEL